MKSGEPFALAGIWENWQRPGTDEWVRTFAIITTNSNELVRPIHDRMPVIIRAQVTTTAGSRLSILTLVTYSCPFPQNQ